MVAACWWQRLVGAQDIDDGLEERQLVATLVDALEVSLEDCRQAEVFHTSLVV